MKILVAGAAGQVGCRLVRQLLARNHEVRGELATGDLTDEAFVDGAVNGVEAVIHTANYVGPHLDNNLQTDRIVTRVCGQYADRLERFVYTSSSAVFPNDSQTIACAYHPVDELHPKRPMGEYALGKLIGEEFTAMAARETGLRTAVVRPSHVQSGEGVLARFTVGGVANMLERGQNSPLGELYMADGTELWHDLLAEAADEGQPCSVRDLEGRPWLYQPNDARDIAHMLVCAVEEPAALGESFNCGAPAPFSYPEAAAILAERTGVEPLEVRLPVWFRYDHDNTKGRSLINFRPRGDLRTMINSALRVRDEGYIDYDWEETS